MTRATMSITQVFPWWGWR